MKRSPASQHEVLARMGWRLAFHPAADHRWRRVAVLVAAALATLLALSGASVGLTLLREADRDSRRYAQLASTDSPDDLLMASGSDFWAGRDITVVWLEPASSTGSPALPPGLTALPPPGASAVSPALDRVINGNPELGARYPTRTLLSWSAVAQGGELLAFVRPTQPTLIRDPDARRFVDGQVVGEGAVKRVTGFGPYRGEGSTIYARGSDLPAGYLAAGLTVMLGVPAALSLWVGLSCGSPVRRRRFALMQAIGAPDRSLRQLAAVESGCLAAPGIIGVVIAWAAVTPWVGRFPVMDRRIVPGDLSWPWWSYPLLVVIGLTVTAVFAMAEVSRHRVGSPRPQVGRGRLRWWMALPLGASAVAFAASTAVGGQTDSDLIMLGAAAAVVGIPLVIPALLRAGGLVLSEQRRVPAFLTGRIMSWSPEWVAKAYVGIAAVLVLSLGGLGYLVTAAYTEPNEPTGVNAGVSAVGVETLQAPTPAQLDAFRASLSGAGVFGVESAETGDPTAAGPLTVAADCPELRALGVAVVCAPGDPYALDRVASEKLARWMQVAADGPVSAVRLVPRDSMTTSDHLLAVGRVGTEQLDQQVRTAAAASFGVFLATSESSMGLRPSALVGWIEGGLLVATVALGLTCLLALVDRLIAARDQHRQLLNMGVSARTLSAVFGWLFAAPYAIVVAAGSAAGMITCLAMLSGEPVPWVRVGAVVGGALLAGAVAAAANAAFGSRTAVRAAD